MAHSRVVRPTSFFRLLAVAPQEYSRRHMITEQELLDERRHTNLLLEGIRHDFQVFGESLSHMGVLVEANGKELSAVKEAVEFIRIDVAVLKTDVAVLKTDVAVLKSDVHQLNGRMKRVEHHLGLNGSGSPGEKIAKPKPRTPAGTKRRSMPSRPPPPRPGKR